MTIIYTTDIIYSLSLLMYNNNYYCHWSCKGRLSDCIHDIILMRMRLHYLLVIYDSVIVAIDIYYLRVKYCEIE